MKFADTFPTSETDSSLSAFELSITPIFFFYKSIAS